VTRRTLLAALVGITGIVLVGPVARAREKANDHDRMTYLKFTHPVRLPGVELAAGTYLFELPDPMGAFEVVRVSSEDRRIIYYTAFTRIVERPNGLRPGQVISFGETRANAPQPITAWWPSGKSTGREFIY